MSSGREFSQNQLQPSTPPPPPLRIISGFWRRLLAFMLDGMIVGLAGFALGLFLFDFFAQLGGWGRLLGFCLVLPYFGVLNSSVGKGQTIGKRIMKIEVVNREGNHISVARSCLRFAVLGAPLFLNQVLIPTSVVMSPLGYLIGFVIFGLGGAVVYLYIFNRRTRQSLHDLVAGTFVVRTTPKGEIAPVFIWKPHLAIVGIWFVVVIASCVAVPRLTLSGPSSDLLAVQKSIVSSGKVYTVGVIVGKRWAWTGGKRYETAYLHSTAVWKTRPDDYEAAAREIASIILGQYPGVMKKDVLVVGVSYGYDIGIARAWRAYTAQHSPQQWQEILDTSYSEKGHI